MSVILSGCIFTSEDDKEELPGPDAGVSDALHFSFKTPEWERNVDCTHLNLPSFGLDEHTYYTFATSQSTKSTFYLSFPADSSAMVKAENIGKYSITDYGMNNEAFQFSFKVPLTDGSSERLVSVEGFSQDVYNEIVSITYLSTEGEEAVFKIKGKYALHAILIGEEGNHRLISGTYHFKIRTSRK